jgi:hypothetical protein
MSRRLDESTSINPTNIADLAQAGARQMEVFLQAQSSLAQRLQETTATSLRGLEEVTNLGRELTAKLLTARSMTDAASAWQEWIGRYVQYAVTDAQRLVNDAQAVFLESANAIAGTGGSRA